MRFDNIGFIYKFLYHTNMCVFVSIYLRNDWTDLDIISYESRLYLGLTHFLVRYRYNEQCPNYLRN